MSEWKNAYNARDDLLEFGDNALALFALGLRFGLEDLASIGADAITDGSDDKKCDLIFTNEEEKLAVIAQCYFSKDENKPSAKANKASDLNTAVPWIFQRDIKDVPDRISPHVKELRELINNGKISQLFFWYIHNLPESKEVQDEMKCVHDTVSSALASHPNFKDKKINIEANEIGSNTLESWYKETLTPILVNENFEISIDGGYSINGVLWNAYATSIPAQFLYRLYKKHKTNLFSANVRDYLGSRSTSSNINNGIRKTIENDHGNFWVFNNGLTILTHEFDISEPKIIKIKGISIVNGAQTTGAIGSLSKLPNKDARVQARFISVTSGNEEVIRNIIQFNNSQNKVEASDFRSTDRIQKRLKKEFEDIPNAIYEGGRRGGASEVIKRRNNLLPSYTVGQALACFHLDPITAYNKKSAIWIDDGIYSKFFNDSTKASHIVCSYGLLKSVEQYKKDLLEKSKKSSTLTKQEEDNLRYFRLRGSIALLVSAISSCLEVFLDRPVSNKFNISFGKISPKNAEVHWDSILKVVVPFCTYLSPALEDGLGNSGKVDNVIKQFSSLVAATKASNQLIYQSFKEKVQAP